MLRVVLILGFSCLALRSAGTADDFAGPVSAEVVKVLDGDTFLADVLIWPEQRLRVNIRIRGIDAPEMHARCDGERSAAEEARVALAALIAGRPVEISHIGGAKYYGRVLADVHAADGVGVAEALLSRKLVRPYDGGKRESWCG